MDSAKPEFINLTEDNIESEHLCCIIRTRKPHLGIEAKRQWLRERIKEGHVFRKLNEKAICFIEYAPLEKAWVPVIGENFYYIYCLWADGNCKGKGYGKALLNYCIYDAKQKGKSGICMLGAKNQKHWLTDQSFAKKHGFEVVDTTKNGYELLCFSFDGKKPYFSESAKKEKINNKELTVFYDMQCPYMLQNIDTVSDYCKENKIPLNICKIDSLEQAKNLPCVFNNFAVFYKGDFQTVNLLLDIKSIEKILSK